jgi:hypothetical protein
MDKLPEFCYIAVSFEDEWTLAIVQRGHPGYGLTNFQTVATEEEAEKWALRVNERMSVTKEHMDAMKIGSMFGWDAPGANLLPALGN